MSKETFELTGLKLREVSLVDRGANPKADVLLFKKDQQPTCKMGHGSDCNMMKDGACSAKGCDMTKAEDLSVDGVKFVAGYREDGSSDVQCVLFSSEAWTAEKAQAWLKAHKLAAGDGMPGDQTIRFELKKAADFKRLRTIVPGKAIAKALSESQSFSRIQNLIDNAVRTKFCPPPDKNSDAPYSYLWVRDIFADNVVFDHEGQTWRATYEASRDNAGKLIITVGDRVPVEIVYQDVKPNNLPLLLARAKAAAASAAASIAV